MRTRKSMSKKSRSCESNDGIEDRLSGLPDELILHILSLMPTLDAVRTMLLRRFRNLWTLVPALGFSFDFYRRWPDDKQSSIHEAFSRFACFVRTVLILHRRSTIDAFRLSIRPIINYQEKLEEAKVIGDVQTWLRFTTEREVKDLYFHYDTLGYLGPPRCIFTSQYLTTLTLSGCMLEHYEHGPQPHMGTLRKVSLIHVRGSNEAFNQLISGCPSLQELVIDSGFSGRGIESLNINAPSVSKLYLRLNLLNYPCTLNCPSVKILDIGVSETSEDFQLTAIDLSSLQEVNLKCLPQSCSSCLLMVVVKALFKLIENAEVFTLSFTAFERISSIEKLEFPQNRWKRIVLYTWPRCSSERCLEVIFKLIRSSVKMEELTIYAESLGKCGLLCSELSTCVMPLLKTVIVLGYDGYKEWCKGNLQLIEFLLKNAVVLDKLVISLGKSELTIVEELDLVKQVSTFRRASANATVIFASS